MREPIIAGLLSLLIPGLGQIYNGRVVIGIVWLLLTGFSWIGSAGLLGWVVHLIAAWCAYSYAKPTRRTSMRLNDRWLVNQNLQRGIDHDWQCLQRAVPLHR